ncbi:MAG: hydroxyacid dehydrogenase [Candidatus Thermoplasmatota archaeon]|nr:hydroxyacid dehydrogenase [Candidatus Thermoplasmatota archaeon]
MINKLDKNTLSFYKQPLTIKNAKNAKNSDIISVYYNSVIDKKMIEHFSNLKLIVDGCTGTDNIDLKTCKKKNIIVSNVPEYCSYSVAEYTFALLLALTKNIHTAYLRTIQGDFSISGLKGLELRKKKLGVIGAGRIGSNVIRIANSFNMDVIVSDIVKNENLSNFLGFDYVSLNQLLKNSDIITLHLPLNDSTYHLLNKENMKLIKRKPILINTSRMNIIDSNALIGALKKGLLSGAALDNFQGINNEMTKKYNLIITPHIGYYTKESIERLHTLMIKNISSFLSGSPINII